MDLRCMKCGEPWENDVFHDLVEEGAYSSYREATRAFARLGCAAIPWGKDGRPCSHSGPIDDPAQLAIISMTADLMGDDTDGIASMLEDAEWMGLI